MTEATKKNKTSRGILIEVLSFVLLFNIFLAVCSANNNAIINQWLPMSFLSVKTGSMYPVIEIGDLVIAKETPYEDCKVGDTVVFYRSGTVIVHEIIDFAEDGRMITKGRYNAKDDGAIEDYEYRAKVTSVVKNGGLFLEVFNSPVVMLLIVLLIVALIWGLPIFNRAFNTKEKKKYDFLMRAVATCALISFVTVGPMIAYSKYVYDLNDFAIEVAEACYFKSNNMSEEGSIYSITGWDGTEYAFNFFLQNYEDELKFNSEDMNVKYKVWATINTENANSQNYDITITKGSNVIFTTDENVTLADEARAQEHSSEYFETELLGGVKRKDEYTLAIKPKGGALPAYTGGDHTQIGFTLYAETENTYHRKLTGSFQFTVAESQTFLGAKSVQQNKGNYVLTYTIHTNEQLGVSSKNVKIKWDSTKLALNEFESPAISYVTQQRQKDNAIKEATGDENAKETPPSIYCKDYTEGADDDEKHYGYLIINLQAKSSVSIQFIKLEDYLNEIISEGTDISSEEVNEAPVAG